MHAMTFDERANRRRILVLTSAAHFLAHFNILIFPALAVPVMQETGLSLDQVLRLSFFMYMLYGLCALPAGLLSDRWNARGMLITCAVGMGVAGVLASLSRSNAEFAASLALVGIFASIYHPAGLALISKAVRDRGTALGINGVYGNLGIALAPFATGILTFFFGWRWAYAVPGLVGIAVGLSFLSIRFDEEPGATEKRSTEAGAPEGARDGLRRWAAGAASEWAPRGGAQNAGPAGARDPADGYLKYFGILCVALLMGGLAYRGHMLILPAYLEMRAGFLKEVIDRFSDVPYQGSGTLASTILASVAYLVGIAGQLVAGRLADRHDLRYLYLTFHFLSIPLLLLIATQSGVPLFLAAAGYALFGLGMQPIENSLIAYFTPVRWRSTSYGIKFVLNFGIGSIAVYLVGWIDGAFGLSSVYYFNAIVVSVLVAAVVILIVTTRSLSVRNR